jgi:NAD(P)-dependent dehydrogenase (short-subunit alcohol dehydrogenase family)
MMKNLFSLEGETAVVTGALGKLGPVWIEALLDAGASVFAIDLPATRLSEPFRKLESLHGKMRLTLGRADVTDRESMEIACRACIEHYGVPGILVNNAGIDSPPGSNGAGHRLEQIPFAAGREILEVNTLGMFLTTQIFGTPMLSTGKGSIINIGSLYAGVSPDGRFYDHIESDPPFLKPPMYGASKAAVVNLTRYLATLWASRGVRVNTLSPGGVLGGQDSAFKRKFCERVPMGRMAVAEDLFGPLLFLASSASAYLTGTELVVDGGFTAW